MLGEVGPLLLEELDLLLRVLVSNGCDALEPKRQVDRDHCLLRLLPVLLVVRRRAHYDRGVDLLRREVFFGQLLQLLRVQ